MPEEPPSFWFAGDRVYGAGNFYFWRPNVTWVGEAREITKKLPDKVSIRYSAAYGPKGDRWYDWLYCQMADLEAAEYSDTMIGIWTRGLLVRRNSADGDLRYLTTWCAQGTQLETLVQAEGTRWRIEEGFENAKNESGLDHNETHS